jgi:hypothetical protein
VLAARDGCTAGKCDAVAMLSDAKRINSNLNEHTYEGLVARNSADWPTRNRTGPPASAGAALAFPPAVSMPPVGVMSNEPPASPPAATPTARAQTGPAAAQPVQLAPPRTSAGSPPRAQ